MVEIIPTPEDLPLVPTSTFPHGDYPFEFFNYLQSLTYPYYDQDVNLIVSASTSAGKTIVAEQSIAYTIAQGKKTIFLSPLKAVTQQRLDDWTEESHFLSKYKTEIITGDYRLTESRIKKVKEADLILMTSEMLDTRTRYINNESNSWIHDVGLLVVDEAHLLTTNRGPALEIGLLKFAEINPQARIILLSATMKNYLDVANWIESLNKKRTAVLATNWRPVDLHYHEINPIKWGGLDFDAAAKLLGILTCPSDEIASHLISKNEHERIVASNRAKGGVDHKKTLVFVHTKAMGAKLVDKLTRDGIACHFHNADLDKTSRNKLEKKFKEDLDVLIATSTLAWGINLPARSVIILGDQRGTEKVSPLDIAQMAGRAGRFGMYDRGDVYLINCQKNDNFEIMSQLKEVLPFHIIAEIYSGHLKTASDVLTWYDRTFSRKTCPMIPSVLITKTLIDLQRYGAVNLINYASTNLIDGTKKDEGTLAVTPLGKIARDLYLQPEDIHNWKNNFNYIEKKNLWKSSAHLAWAISNNIKTVALEYTPQPLKGIASAYRQNLNGDLTVNNSAVGAIIYFRLIRDELDSYQAKQLDVVIAPYLQLLLRDSGRIFGAIKRISTLSAWDKERTLTVLQARVVHGVGEHLVDLVGIPGIGSTIAVQLYKAGLRNLEDIKKNKDKLGDLIERKGNVTRILNSLKELEELEKSNIDFDT